MKQHIGAKNEGEVVFYTVWLPETVKIILSAFNKRYPWLAVEWVRLGTYAVVEKVEAEILSEKIMADVVRHNDIGTFLDWKKKGHLLRYPSAEFAYYDSESKDPDGYWGIVRSLVQSIAFNVQALESAGMPAPRSYLDLLNPRYEGKIVLPDPRVAGDMYQIYWSLRTIFGREY